MLSHLYQCLFIHIPKCGGTTVEKYFYHYAGGYDPHKTRRLPVMRHGGLTQILNMYPGYFSFTFVRNPYDRLVSYYLHGIKIQEQYDYVSYRNFQECIELVSELLNNDSFPAKPGAKFGPLQVERRLLNYEAYHGLPQKDFLLDYNPDVYFGVPRVDKKPCSFIGRLENFSEDFAQVQRILDLPRPRIPHIRWESRSLKQYRHYSTYYDRDTRRQVEELYAEDLEILGYEYEQEDTVCVPSLSPPSRLPPLYELQKAEQCKPGKLSRIQTLVWHWKFFWHKSWVGLLEHRERWMERWENFRQRIRNTS